MGESEKNIMKVEQFLDRLWENYITYTPSAKKNISTLWREGYK